MSNQFNITRQSTLAAVLLAAGFAAWSAPALAKFEALPPPGFGEEIPPQAVTQTAELPDARPIEEAALPTGVSAGAPASDDLSTVRRELDLNVPEEDAEALKEADLLDDEPLGEEDTDLAENDDPLEDFNRATQSFNSMFRKYVLDPVVDGFQTATPDIVQDALSNVVENLQEPVTIVASALQGDFDNAMSSTERLLINTTVGIGGLRDVATDYGITARREDFGQTLAHYGVEEGPYVVVPILGPSNFRDGLANLATGFGNPIPFAGQAAGGTVEYSDNQDALQAVVAGSLDPYTAEKTAFQQFRQFQVSNGEAPAALEEDGPAIAGGPSLDDGPGILDLDLEGDLEEGEEPNLASAQDPQ